MSLFKPSIRRADSSQWLIGESWAFTRPTLNLLGTRPLRGILERCEHAFLASLESHLEDVLTRMEQANFIMSMLMMVATSLVKLSITEFYLHIFPHGWLHHVCHIQLVALTLFMIGQIVAILTICQPVAASFDFSIHGKCGDIVDFWLSISIIALFFDISCVILPMPIFWTTNLCQRKKWKLTVLFGLGFMFVSPVLLLKVTSNFSSICGLTGVRVWVYRVIDFNDTTWGYAHGTMLTIIEPSLGILAGCIPIMSPCLASLARRVKSGFPLVKGGATANSPKAGGGGNKRISNPFKRLEDHMYPLTDVKVSHATETRRSSTEALTEDVLNIGGITVHREIVVDSVYEDWQSRQHRPRD